MPAPQHTAEEEPRLACWRRQDKPWALSCHYCSEKDKTRFRVWLLRTRCARRTVRGAWQLATISVGSGWHSFTIFSVFNRNLVADVPAHYRRGWTRWPLKVASNLNNSTITQLPIGELLRTQSIWLQYPKGATQPWWWRRNREAAQLFWKRKRKRKQTKVSLQLQADFPNPKGEYWLWALSDRRSNPLSWWQVKCKYFFKRSKFFQGIFHHLSVLRYTVYQALSEGVKAF